MKRRSLVSAVLVASTLATLAGNINAAATNGYIYSGDNMYKWHTEGTRLVVETTNTSYGSTTNYSDFAGDLTIMELKNSMNYAEYNFYGITGGGDASTVVYPNVKTIYISGNCNEFGNMYQYPGLENIYVNGNSLDYITLDFTNSAYETLPVITNNSSYSTDVGVLFHESISEEVTVPACYSDDSIHYFFQDSVLLQEVTFEDGTTRIPHDAFNNCSGLSTVNIPSGVTLIEYSAFEDCSDLKTISIPSSVEEIKADAFLHTGLEDIYYEGTTGEWTTLTQEYDETNGNPIPGGNVLHLNETVVHCSDGNILIRNLGDENDPDYWMGYLGWIKESNGKWRYYNESGGCQTGAFVEIDGGTYSFDSDGYMLTGWQQAGDWFYFKSSGQMTTGWTKVGKKWYYFSDTGAMQTGWQQIGGKWYYLGTDGAMKTGWQKISNKWYYFNTSGVMQTGWQKISNKWYYFASGGAMYSNQWLKSGGKWYYFGSDGVMLSNTSQKIGNKTYNFDSNGVCTNP